MKHLFPLALIALISFACNKEEPTPVDPPIEEEDTSGLDLAAHIGSSTPYNNSDAICTITPYTGADFESNKIPVGQKVNDFTLYNNQGVAYNLEDKLLEGKPLMIMTGSYTCPVFRAVIWELNSLITNYGNDINFVVVYTVEAHPDIDYSPYYNTVQTTQINVNEGILYEQPETYGERVNIVNDMLNAYAINCEVLIDSPCNEFWYAYGEAPNRAYLIDSTGKVVVSQGWFNFPVMTSEIDDYLGN